MIRLLQPHQFKILRSLNGRLGYLSPTRHGYRFVGKDGKTIWEKLRDWEVREALKPENRRDPDDSL